MASGNDEYKRLRSIIEFHRARRDAEWPRPKGPVDPSEGTVALVGKGMCRADVPWGREGYEFWGLNDPPSPGDGYAPIKCHNRWFQLHPPSYMEKHYPQGLIDLELAWSRETGVTLYMDEHYDEYPDSVPYPMEEVMELPGGSYHTSSFDWMVALAVLEGWRRIELYGCDFHTFPTVIDGEPLSARPCLEFWLGVAAGRGAQIEVHGLGDVFCNIHVAVHKSELMYGFEREPALDLAATDGNWRDVR